MLRGSSRLEPGNWSVDAGEPCPVLCVSCLLVELGFGVLEDGQV